MGPIEEIIKRRLKARRLGSDRIFHRSGKVMGEYRKAWKTACERAQVKDRRPYDLRRTAVRDMIRAGVDPTVAMKISGHQTRAVFDRYNIVADEDLRNAVIKTEQYLKDRRAEDDGEVAETGEPAGSR